MAFEGLACTSACGWCGMCTPDYGLSVNHTGGRADDLPAPIPGLGARVAAEKAKRALLKEPGALRCATCDHVWIVNEDEPTCPLCRERECLARDEKFTRAVRREFAKPA